MLGSGWPILNSKRSKPYGTCNDCEAPTSTPGGWVNRERTNSNRAKGYTKHSCRAAATTAVVSSLCFIVPPSSILSLARI
jgi:hypothetical protein